MSIIIYITVMALTTYLIRVIPFALVQKKIKSRFIKSVLHYIPYAVLSAMTFPSILYSTENLTASFVGTIAALIMAFFDLPLIAVALSSSLCAFIVMIAPNFITL